MNRDELKNYIGITGANVGHIEKDYLQHIILSGISRKYSGKMIFKGGTALQKAGVIKRFSEDLDFTIKEHIDSSSLIHDVKNSIKPYNYPVDIDRIKDDERTITFRVVVEGPLFRNKRGVCTIRLESSRREELIHAPVEKTVSPVYYDIMPYIFLFMNLKEVAAEKVRAILTRNKARDLYDLSILLNKGITPVENDINDKLKYYNIEYSEKKFIEKCKSFSKIWESEMAPLVSNLPPFEEIINIIIKPI